MILVCLFFFTIRQIVPKQPAIKGNQYLVISTSGFCLAMVLPTWIQFNGLIELTQTRISRSGGLGDALNCVFPGKSNEGY